MKSPALYSLKQSQDRLQLIALVSIQVKKLAGFINFKNNLTDDQVVETAELIVDKHDDLSLLAIEDCFTRLKAASPPFDRPLYQSLDGRKLMLAFADYRDMQANEREKKYKNEKAAYQLNAERTAGAIDYEKEADYSRFKADLFQKSIGGSDES